ncbi:uncharacterized protein BT62DRAFT_998853 [Guyanagaster necrorhizus]|uniref:Uncharacterized protein n=1 Tax=Guyanagaster necrorhizus TaxID=856835 RepID=A0A9P7W593_9AGAR|nr:uncharacterized protein BT62DRAFT_998853 [Guyanagaster necrorhizus MCA 3950]KAG7452829.1 hypothetical protein BT62DRAFT_998853 [Guyanagaster necrorhizus MCA 3950]
MILGYTAFWVRRSSGFLRLFGDVLTGRSIALRTPSAQPLENVLHTNVMACNFYSSYLHWLLCLHKAPELKKTSGGGEKSPVGAQNRTLLLGQLLGICPFRYFINYESNLGPGLQSRPAHSFFSASILHLHLDPRRHQATLGLFNITLRFFKSGQRPCKQVLEILLLQGSTSVSS